MKFVTPSFRIGVRGLSGIATLCALPFFAAATENVRDSSSAFLRAYAGTAVEWHPWGEAAIALAQKEQRPLFIAIGAFTSELSRAMARQSFSNADTAALLRDNFVCVLADAKEQPELTALLQNYIQSVKQLSGLPLNVWLTPDLKPFEGANYLPPTEEWGKEGFVTVAKRTSAAWKANPAGLKTKAAEAVTTMNAALQAAAPAPLNAQELDQLLKEAVDLWRTRFDATAGGFSEAPKYPEPELLRFLLRQAPTRDAALTTLRAVASGALHDPLDGGYFRYVIDTAWHQPYLQKTLTDQARIALAFLDARTAADEPLFSEAARSGLNYVLDRLALPSGEVTAAEDATLENVAPAYFWSLAEIKEVLGDADTAEFARAFAATTEGNLPADAIAGVNTAGKNVLYRATPFGAAAAEKSLALSAAKLLRKRDQRAKTPRDEISTSGAHGLLLEALSRAATELKDERFAAAAKTQFTFIRDHLVAANGELRHLADRATSGSPQDYALVVGGLAAYQTSAGNASAGKLASALLANANAHLLDSAKGRYFASSNAPAAGLWMRVYSPNPTVGEPPTAEPAMLAVIASFKLEGSDLASLQGKLAAAIASDIRASSDPARGDELLALEAFQHRP